MNTTTDLAKLNATPKPTWASWALVKEARKGNAEAAALCVERLDVISGHNPPLAYVVTTSCGHWGAGETAAEAAAQAHKAGARKTSRAFLVLVINDPKPEVNSAGSLLLDSQGSKFDVGWVRTLGALLAD